MSKLNLPNKLTIIRLIMVPVVLLFLACDFGIGPWNRMIAALVFLAAALTDMADGKIARKRNLITDFGKFLDPLADKFLVIAGLITLCFVDSLSLKTDELDKKIYCYALFVMTVIVIFRELAVTSLRLVVASSKENVVIAANIFGKIKTGSQITFVLLAMVAYPFVYLCPIAFYIVIYFVMLFSTVMTILSGITYFKGYWKYINPEK